MKEYLRTEDAQRVSRRQVPLANLHFIAEVNQRLFAGVENLLFDRAFRRVRSVDHFSSAQMSVKCLLLLLGVIAKMISANRQLAVPNAIYVVYVCSFHP